MKVCLVFALAALAPALAAAEGNALSYPAVDTGLQVELKARHLEPAAAGGSETIGIALLRPYYARRPDADTLYVASAKLYASDSDGADDTTSSREVGRHYLEVTELYWQEDATGDAPWHYRAGVQRLDDRAGHWWDAPLTGAAVVYDGSLLRGYVAVGDRSNYLRTDWNESHPESRTALMLLGQLDWQWRLDHWLTARSAGRLDRARDEQVGQQLPRARFGGDEVRAFWLGVQAQGEWHGEASHYPRYEVELAGASGRATRLRSGRVAASDDVKVIAREAGDIGGLLWRLEGQYVWVDTAIWRLGAGYLYAAGAAGQDQGFVQTGMASNRNGLFGTETRGSLTGEALRLGLSNVELVQAHGVYSPDRRQDVILAWRKARRAQAGGDVTLAGARLAPDGSDHLGESLDISYGWRLRPPLRDRSRLYGGGFEGTQVVAHAARLWPDFVAPGDQIAKTVYSLEFFTSF